MMSEATDSYCGLSTADQGQVTTVTSIQEAAISLSTGHFRRCPYLGYLRFHRHLHLLNRLCHDQGLANSEGFESVGGQNSKLR